MKNKKAAYILAIFFFILFLLLLLRGQEDNWICQKGEWIKHGHPATEKPKTECKFK